MLTSFFPLRRLQRIAVAALPVVAGCFGMHAAAEAGGGGILHLRCTNAVGGANWPVVIDLDRGLVDSNPATISQSSIEWRDEKGGIYELDRASGKLQLRGASSTGGYFLHYACKTE